METKEINQWIPILSREEAIMVLEEEEDNIAVVEAPLMMVIQMKGVREGISMIIEKNVIIEDAAVVVVVAAMVDSTNANNANQISTTSRSKLLNLRFTVAVIAVEELDVVAHLDVVVQEVEMTSM